VSLRIAYGRTCGWGGDLVQRSPGRCFHCSWYLLLNLSFVSWKRFNKFNNLEQSDTQIRVKSEHSESPRPESGLGFRYKPIAGELLPLFLVPRTQWAAYGYSARANPVCRNPPMSLRIAYRKACGLFTVRVSPGRCFRHSW